MKNITILIAVLALASATTRWFQLEDYEFERYEVEFSKRYASEVERDLRRSIFDENLAKIKLHNKDSTKSWKEGVNKFTDRSREELKKTLGLNQGLLYSTKQESAPFDSSSVDLSALPINVDWRENDIISDVKDQGQCGSCWTFGTMATVESYWALATGDLQDLSEQAILDCTANSDDCGGYGGCEGGIPELVYAKIQKLGGIQTEWEYPYTSYWGEAESCALNSTDIPFTMAASILNFTVLPSNNYSAVMQHIAQEGPLAVNVDASSWFKYETGVFNGCNQTDPEIDHVVQLVGYGTDPVNGDYWLVRNSWNPTFGEKGYIRIARSSDSQCAYDTSPKDGTGCNGGPSKVLVCGSCGILYDTSYPTVMVF